MSISANGVADGVADEVADEVANGVAEDVLDRAGLYAELAQNLGPDLAREIEPKLAAEFDLTLGNTLRDTLGHTLRDTLTEELAIYNPVQYNYLWRTSWLFLLSACYTVYLQKYDCAVFPTAIFLTSLNYWRNPRFNSWQRTLDVGCVQSSVVYSIFRSSGAENAYPFCAYMTIGLFCYLLSNYNHRLKRLYVSSMFHSLVHVFGNVAILYLYSGEIMDTWNNPVMRWVRVVLENLVE
jgi:hypothetical protein